MSTALQRALRLLRQEAIHSRSLLISPQRHTSRGRHLIATSSYSTTTSLRSQPPDDVVPPTPELRSSEDIHAPLPSPTPPISDPAPAIPLARRVNLPLSCPGCGALTQTQSEEDAGYYTATRRAVAEYLSHADAEAVYAAALKDAPSEILREAGMRTSPSAVKRTQSADIDLPYCDRCHDIVHHNAAASTSIAHPSLRAIEATIEESPHKYNHIWHVVDAADFPMSLVFNIDKRLSLAHLRTKNRRAKDVRYTRGGQVELSFIITRADLLATDKESVDKLMPGFRKILREAIGGYGDAVRLGNVHLVSAHRGWWTPKIKETILRARGGHWLVGKVNVGKSKLFEVIYPKGTNNQQKELESQRERATDAHMELAQLSLDGQTPTLLEEEDEPELSSEFSLLPPPQPMVSYPTMPTISSLSGTTASPIRIPFARGKGELIDLPGLRRGTLTEHVLPQYQNGLLMEKRVVPERLVLKPGQSLLLGNLIRIAPLSPNVVVLAHAFTPLASHVTSHDKARDFQTGVAPPMEGSVIAPEAQAEITSAGRFTLKDDVTKVYAGPLTRSDAVGLKAEKLPFIIYATDILIEGVGWVELHAQVRRRPRIQLPDTIGQTDSISELAALSASHDANAPPQIEVFSPQGRYVSQRTTLKIYDIAKPEKRRNMMKRPRESMVSKKNRRPKGTPTGVSGRALRKGTVGESS